MIQNFSLGYDKPLFILAFDHRASFLKLFGYQESLDPKQLQEAKDAKRMIYEGFKKAVLKGTPPKDHGGILVDEQFGDVIHEEARDESYITLLTIEKSGQDEFDFEYGEKFGEHIEKYKPTFAKVLRTTELLEYYGPYLGMPHSKRITRVISELRIRGKIEVRILYVQSDRTIYLLHAFQKKSQKTPKKELKIAEARLQELGDWHT